MSKQKTPVLSLEAHGTIGGAVTYQGKGRRKIAREKPQLPYFLTLPAQYQRWLYADYIAQWNNLTDAQKQVHRSAGSPVHRTGLQQFMRYHLLNLPDLAAYWKLDGAGAPTLLDSSRNGNHGTIFGASPAVGIIDRCLSFDGLNDMVTCGNDPSLSPTTLLSVECFVAYQDGYSILGTMSGVLHRGYRLYFHVEDEVLNWLCNGWAPPQPITTPIAPFLDGAWHHIAATYDGTTGRLYADGSEVKQVPKTGDITIDTNPFTMGARWKPAPDGWLEGRIDQAKVYNRILTPAQILTHSQRRWPPE